MAKKVLTLIKLQIPAGAANPAPPVGPALGQHGVNIMDFCKAFNAQTQQDGGTIIPVEITVFEDRSLHLHHQDAARRGPDQGSDRDPEGLRRAARQQGRHDQRRPDPRDRREEDARPQRQRPRRRLEDHRRHRPLDGRRRRREADRWPAAGKRYRAAVREGRARPTPTRRPRRRADQGDRERQASTRRSRCTSGSASTSATPTSSCAARWRCPHGLGKDVTVAVFAEGEQARDAEAAGADFVGGEDLAEKVEEGWTDFDVAIATPDMMPNGRPASAAMLGPQGKMPNPKVGTVTDDVEKAVSESKSGKIEYRTDRQAIVHLAIGKASFDEQATARELHRGDRRDRPRQARLGQGPLHLSVTLATRWARHPGRHRAKPTRARATAGASRDGGPAEAEHRSGARRPPRLRRR